VSAGGRDQRTAPRYRVLGHVQIIDQGSTINCVVRDLSDTGAKLGVSSQAKLPPEFDLWFVQRKLKLRVRLQWRRGDYAGVAFCDPHYTLKAPEARRNEQYVLDV
jgi:hypothetical protein